MPSVSSSTERRSGSPGRIRRHETCFITLDTARCEACWECVGVCPNRVLGKVSLLFHSHARIVDADACTGCLKCVRVCEAGAVKPRGDR